MFVITRLIIAADMPFSEKGKISESKSEIDI